MNQFLFLGTGASTGVPVIGCHCAVCSSPSPLNKRLRPSGLLRWEGKSFLIDAGPDFRQQALTHGIEQLDGLLLTHTHFDHLAGIDDLRVYAFRTKKPMACLLSQDSLEILRQRYSYLFSPRFDTDHAQITFQPVQEDGPVVFEGAHLHTFSYYQGQMRIMGLRAGPFAYVSDIRVYDDALFTHLKGVKQLVVSALRDTPSKMHLSLDEAIAFARRVGAENTWITHLAHDLDHEKTESLLPSDIRLGYDGLICNIR